MGECHSGGVTQPYVRSVCVHTSKPLRDLTPFWLLGFDLGLGLGLGLAWLTVYVYQYVCWVCEGFQKWLPDKFFALSCPNTSHAYVYRA